MKIAFWCLIMFLCGLAGGAVFAARHLLFAGGQSTAQGQAQAFDRWQEAAGPDGQVDFKTREDLLPLMAQADGPRAWKALMQTAVKPRMADMQQIAREWAKQDGRAAATFGLGIQDPVERNTFLTVAFSCWFGQDPRAFVEWLKTQPAREPIVACMSYSEYKALIKPEVASLECFAALYADTPQTPKPLRNLVMHVWEQGRQKDAVMDWLRRQPESEDRDYSWRDIANDLAMEDAPAAAALAKEVTSPDIRRYLCSSVAAWMAKADIEAALAYAQSLPDEPGRDQAWGSAMGTWLMHDPAAVLAYLKAHQDSITTDKLQPMMGTWMAWLPVESLAVLQVMKGSDKSREAVVESLLREWRDRSRDDLGRWLDSPAAAWLTPEKLKRYRQLFQVPPSMGGSGSRNIQGRRVWR